MFFTMKLVGASGFNFPTIKFCDEYTQLLWIVSGCSPFVCCIVKTCKHHPNTIQIGSTQHPNTIQKPYKQHPNSIQIRSNSIKYNQIQSNTIEYHQIPSSTIKFNQTSSNTIKYNQIPSNTIKCLPIPRFSFSPLVFHSAVNLQWFGVSSHLLRRQRPPSKVSSVDLDLAQVSVRSAFLVMKRLYIYIYIYAYNTYKIDLHDVYVYIYMYIYVFMHVYVQVYVHVQRNSNRTRVKHEAAKSSLIPIH